MRRSALTGLLVLVLAMPGAAQEQSETRTRVVEAFSAEAVGRIDAIAAEAEAGGVSATPIFDKALEGRAKGVPEARILPALQSYSARLLQSHSLLGDDPAQAAVLAGADALARGASPEAVRAVGRDARERSPMALVVLGDLAEAGVPTEGAVDVVRQALDSNQATDAVLHVPAAVRRLLRDGQSPDRAVNDVTRFMRDGVPPQRIRDGRGG